MIEAGCNAHGRRKFRDAEATQPILAAEGGAFIGAIYGEEEKAQELGLSGDALLSHRQTFIRPLVEDFERWRAAVAPTLLPSEPLSAAIRYYDNHHAALFRFVEDPEVPIDNSPTEREFQNVAKLRLNMLFAGSTEGAHRACVLLGIIATCRGVATLIRFDLGEIDRVKNSCSRDRILRLPTTETTPPPGTSSHSTNQSFPIEPTMPKRAAAGRKWG